MAAVDGKSQERLLAVSRLLCCAKALRSDWPAAGRLAFPGNPSPSRRQPPRPAAVPPGFLDASEPALLRWPLTLPSAWLALRAHDSRALILSPHLPAQPY